MPSVRALRSESLASVNEFVGDIRAYLAKRNANPRPHRSKLEGAADLPWAFRATGKLETALRFGGRHAQGQIYRRTDGGDPLRSGPGSLRAPPRRITVPQGAREDRKRGGRLKLKVVPKNRAGHCGSRQTQACPCRS